MTRLNNQFNNPRRRRGFTLVEVIVAGVIAAFIIGSISMTVGQLARTKNSSRQRLAAHLRADAALNAIRSDVASIIRDTDLFYTRLEIRDDARDSPAGVVDRDEVVLFNTRLRAVRDLSFQGEGLEYETQYRVEDDSRGPVLWQRRDSVPDEFVLGGGQAIPLVEGVIGLSFEAYDGLDWFQTWDSDEDGLPLAVRITVVASGHSTYEDLGSAPIAALRTVVPIDRVVPPIDRLLPTPEEELELEEYLDELLANFGQPSGPQEQEPELEIPNPGVDVELDNGAAPIFEVDGREALERGRGRGQGGGRPGAGGGGGGGQPPPGTGGGRPSGTGGSSGSTGNLGSDE